jgi:hypothetical protein
MIAKESLQLVKRSRPALRHSAFGTAPCVGARRTLHLRFNDLVDPQPIPRDTDYASVFESDVPIIVQHTRLDSRQAELALLSTVAYSEG